MELTSRWGTYDFSFLPEAKVETLLESFIRTHGYKKALWVLGCVLWSDGDLTGNEVAILLGFKDYETYLVFHNTTTLSTYAKQRGAGMLKRYAECNTFAQTVEFVRNFKS